MESHSPTLKWLIWMAAAKSKLREILAIICLLMKRKWTTWPCSNASFKENLHLNTPQHLLKWDFVWIVTIVTHFWGHFELILCMFWWLINSFSFNPKTWWYKSVFSNFKTFPYRFSTYFLAHFRLLFSFTVKMSRCSKYFNKVYGQQNRNWMFLGRSIMNFRVAKMLCSPKRCFIVAKGIFSCLYLVWEQKFCLAMQVALVDCFFSCRKEQQLSSQTQNGPQMIEFSSAFLCVLKLVTIRSGNLQFERYPNLLENILGLNGIQFWFILVHLLYSFGTFFSRQWNNFPLCKTKTPIA